MEEIRSSWIDVKEDRSAGLAYCVEDKLDSIESERMRIHCIKITHRAVSAVDRSDKQDATVTMQLVQGNNQCVLIVLRLLIAQTQPWTEAHTSP